jgi:uncharacterized protein YjbJ (UPF0337 family)
VSGWIKITTDHIICPVITDELLTRKKHVMNKDRVEGSAKQAAGAVKEVAGKLMGDAKLKTEGKAEKIEGKIQNAIGGLKDVAKK